MSIQAALQNGPFTLRDVAREAGLSYHAIQSYALGRRTPDPEIAERLAAILDSRGKEIAKLSRDLRRVARRKGAR